MASMGGAEEVEQRTSLISTLNSIITCRLFCCASMLLAAAAIAVSMLLAFVGPTPRSPAHAMGQQPLKDM